MTASQWSHLDAALSFTRIQHPRTGASGLRYRSTRTSYLLRRPWSWPSAFVLTRETVPRESSVGVAWYSEAIPFRDSSSQSHIRRTTSGLHLAYIVDVPPAAAVKRYQEKARAVSCHMLLLIVCPSIHIHTPGFTSLALSLSTSTRQIDAKPPASPIRITNESNDIPSFTTRNRHLLAGQHRPS
jgi:hypothetical protein